MAISRSPSCQILEKIFPSRSRRIRARRSPDHTVPHRLGTSPHPIGEGEVPNMVDDDSTPLYPFGFGLSYSTFRYDHFAVQTPEPGSKAPIEVSVDVTNTGQRDGDEVAQLYVRENVSSVETPERSLTGFSRVHLKAGETQRVTFSVSLKQLAVWNVNRQWAIEPGTYTVWAGGSSQASLSATFQLHP